MANRNFITNFAANSILIDTAGFTATLPSGVTYDATIVRGSQPRSLKIVAASGSNAATVVTNGSDSGFVRAHIRVTARPATTARVLFGAIGAGLVNIRLNANGTLAYYVNTTLIGTSTTALTDTTRWYRVEYSAVSGASAPILKIDGATEITAAVGGTSATSLRIGPNDTVASTYTVYFADLIADGGEWVGNSTVLLVSPSADTTVGTGWQKPGGATTNLYTSIDNMPPVGVADSTNVAQAENQIRNASSNSASYVATLPSPTSLGVPAGATPIGVMAWCATGAPVSTSAKTGSFAGTWWQFFWTGAFGLNSGQFWTGVAAGTYPTGWKLEMNTAAAGGAAGSSSSTGTTTVAITGGTASRIAMVASIGLYLEYDPSTIVLPGTASLDLTGFAPTAAIGANQNVLPGAGALSLTGFAPSVATPQNVAAGAGALTLTGFAPTVAVSGGASAITFPATTGYAVAANTAAIGNAAALAVKMRLRGDAFNPATNGYHKILQIDAALTGGANLKFILAIRAETSAGGVVMYDTVTGGLGAKQLGNIAKAGFDVSKYYILYFHYDPSSGTEKMRATVTLDESPFTSMLDTSSNILLTGALLAGSTFGIVRVHRAYDAIGAQDITVDGLALYSAILASGDRATEPTASDANLLAYWPMSEGSGTSTAEVNGGNALTLTAATWQAEGSWPSTAAPANVAPGVGALSLTGFAPGVAVSDNRNVLAGVGALALTGFAPSLVIGTRVLAGAGALALNGFPPTVAVSNNQAALAGTGALTLAGFAPSAVVGVRVLAGVGALTLAGFAPTVAVSNNQNVAPGLGALALAGFASTPTVSNNQAALPGAGALTLSGFAPSIVVGQRVLAGVGALALTGFAPTVSVTNNQNVLAGAGALTLTGFAPSAIVNVRVFTGVGALALSGFAPNIALSNNQAALPGKGAVALTGFAPTIVIGVRVLAGAGALALSGFAPSIAVTNNQAALPGAAALSLSGFAPTATSSNQQGASPATGALSLSGLAPTVAISNNQRALPGTGALALTGFAPGITLSDNRVALPGVGALSLTGFAPSVVVNVRPTPGVAALALSGFAPTAAVSDQRIVFPGTGVLALAGFAPTVSLSNQAGAAPGTGLLALAGFTPTIAITDQKVVTPGTGLLALQGLAPTAFGADARVAQPGTGALLLAGLAPSVAVTDQKVALPGAGALLLTGFAPAIALSDNVTAQPGRAALSLAGFAPAVAVTSAQEVTPGVGALVLTGFAPFISILGPSMAIDGRITIGPKLSGDVIVRARFAGDVVVGPRYTGKIDISPE